MLLVGPIQHPIDQPKHVSDADVQNESPSDFDRKLIGPASTFRFGRECLAEEMFLMDTALKASKDELTSLDSRNPDERLAGFVNANLHFQLSAC